MAYSRTVHFSAPPDLAKAKVTHLVSSEETESHVIDREFLIGRLSGDLQVPNDPFLSGQHAAVRRAEGEFVLHDLNSTNGTFVRLRSARVLEDGDVLTIGSQMFRFRLGGPADDAPEPDAPSNVTRSLGFGDPQPRLERVLEGGREGETHSLTRDRTEIGRTSGELTVPEDDRLSDPLAAITREESGGETVFRIHDEESAEGVFLRIRSGWPLAEGDVFTAGRQVFRFEGLETPQVDGFLTVRLDLDPTPVP